jgi:hypothetical protein
MPGWLVVAGVVVLGGVIWPGRYGVLGVIG